MTFKKRMKLESKTTGKIRLRMKVEESYIRSGEVKKKVGVTGRVRRKRLYYGWKIREYKR